MVLPRRSQAIVGSRNSQMRPISSKPSFRVQLLRPVVAVCDQEGEVVAGLARGVERARHGRPRQASVPEPLEREHVLDLADLRLVVQLAVASDLAVDASREEARVRPRRPSHAGSRRVAARPRRPATRGSVCQPSDQTGTSSSIGTSSTIDVSTSRSGSRRATMITSHSTVQPSSRNWGSSRSPASSSTSSTLRCVSPAEPRMRSVSAASSSAVTAPRSRVGEQVVAAPDAREVRVQVRDAVRDGSFVFAARSASRTMKSTQRSSSVIAEPPRVAELAQLGDVPPEEERHRPVGHDA